MKITADFLLFERRSRFCPTGIALASLFAMLGAGLALGQTSQFTFDPNGNLLIQAAPIVAAPQILGQPSSTMAAPGGIVSFSVVVADLRALSYQWRFNGSNLGGATGDTLMLNNVSTNSEGFYFVVLSNSSGSVTSAPAALYIDSDADGLPDSWEIAMFGHLNFTGSDDADGDGVSNLQEFLDGTSPTNALSALYRITLAFDGGSVAVVPSQPSYTNGQTVALTATPTGGEPFHAWTGDVVTRSNTITLVMTNNKSLFAHFSTITSVWTNTTTGDWNTDTNWSPNLAPGSNDTAVLATGATVTLNNDLDLRDLSLGNDGNSPILTGTGTVRVLGLCLWTAGTMAGQGNTVIAPGALLMLRDLDSVGLSGRTLENQGTVLWSTAAILNVSNAVILNDAGALFSLQNPATINFAGGSLSRFDNAGTFLTSIFGGTTLFAGVAFNNSGTVQVQSGTLQLAGGGTNTGVINVPAGTTLSLGPGPFSSSAGSSIAGAGALLVSGASGILAGTVNVSGSNVFVNGSLDFTGNYICTNNSLLISGNPSFDGTGIVAPALLNLSGGSLGGSSTVTVSGVMNWTGGSMVGSGRTVVAGGATLNLSNTAPLSMNGRTLDIAGTAVCYGASVAMNDAVITNEPDALFYVPNPGSFAFGGGSPRFDNAGTVRADGTGISFIAPAFNNYSNAQLHAGTTLQLVGGGLNDGTIAVDAGATLEFGGGVFVASPRSGIAGDGQLRINGGTATLGGLVNVTGTNTFSNGAAHLTGNYLCANNTLIISGGTATFDGTGTVAPLLVNLSSGTLGGAQTVTVGKAMNWTGGTMSGTGRTVIPPGAMLSLGGPDFLSLTSRILDNGGTAVWTGAGNLILTDAVITNRPGSLFDVQNAAFLNLGGGAARFDNAGTFRKSVSPGTTGFSGVSFNNYGVVDLERGILWALAGFTSTSNALLNCALGGSTPGTNYGQLQLLGPVALNGVLSVNFTDGFHAATNDSFTVVSAGSCSAGFANFFYPSNLITMALSNTANSVGVLVTAVGVADRVLVPPQISGTNITLCWGTLPNVTYRVEMNSTLDPGTWTPLPGDVTSSGDMACKSDVLMSSNRFYRIRILP